MNNTIHPTAILDGDVRLGEGNVVLPYTILQGPLEIGNSNVIGPQAVIGTPGQDTRSPRYDSSASLIRIGSGNIIREHVAIQKPRTGTTVVGSNTFLMHGAHVPHDAVLEDDVVLAPGAAVGGYAQILRGANLGINCAVHQRVVVGQFSIAAMGAPVLKNIRPFSRYIPGQPLTVNHYAIDKFGFTDRCDEITQYVLGHVPPRSAELSAIIAHYEAVHRESSRADY